MKIQGVFSALLLNKKDDTYVTKGKGVGGLEQKLIFTDYM